MPAGLFWGGLRTQSKNCIPPQSQIHHSHVLENMYAPDMGTTCTTLGAADEFPRFRRYG